MVNTVVEDGPHKVFIGGIPGYLQEEQVRGPQGAHVVRAHVVLAYRPMGPLYSRALFLGRQASSSPAPGAVGLNRGAASSQLRSQRKCIAA